jgi:hypothetical protein
MNAVKPRLVTVLKAWRWTMEKVALGQAEYGFTMDEWQIVTHELVGWPSRRGVCDMRATYGPNKPAVKLADPVGHAIMDGVFKVDREYRTDFSCHTTVLDGFEKDGSYYTMTEAYMAFGIPYAIWNRIVYADQYEGPVTAGMVRDRLGEIINELTPRKVANAKAPQRRKAV